MPLLFDLLGVTDGLLRAALFHVVFVPMCLVIALAYRLRGGALAYLWAPARGRTTVARLFWGLVIGTIVTLMTLGPAPWWLWPINVLAGYLTMVVTGQSAHQAGPSQRMSDPPPGDGEWTETVTRWLPHVIARTESTLWVYNFVGYATIFAVRTVVLLLPTAVAVMRPELWGAVAMSAVTAGLLCAWLSFDAWLDDSGGVQVGPAWLRTTIDDTFAWHEVQTGWGWGAALLIPFALLTLG